MVRVSIRVALIFFIIFRLVCTLLSWLGMRGELYCFQLWRALVPGPGVLLLLLLGMGGRLGGRSVRVKMAVNPPP